MKKILFFAFFLTITATISAQRPYFNITKGAVMDYTIYDAKGNESSTSRTTIKDVQGANGNYTVVLVGESFIDGKPIIQPMELTATITDGKVSVALGNSGASIDTDGDIPFIPSQLAVGMELDCGTMTMDIGGIKAENTIYENKVIDRENLETPAGTFKCYIVEQVYEAKVFGMKMKGKSRTWYSRGVGIIKMETYDAKNKIAQTQLLTGYTK